MYAIDEYRLTLEDFEGPIGLLLHLVQKNEVDIFALCLREVTHQYLKDLVAANIDEGADKILKQYWQNNFSTYLKLNGVIQKSIERARKIRKEIMQTQKAQLFATPVQIPPGQRPFAKNEAELQSRIQEEIMAFIQAEKKRFGDADVMRNVPQTLALYENHMEQLEDPYLPLDIHGEHRTQAEIENLNALHILKAIASSLDAHTEFMDPKEAYEMKVRLKKGFFGVGIEFENRPSGITVKDVIPGSPAAKNGQIKPGDVLIAVNEQETTKDVFGVVVDKLRGAKNTEVRLTFKRLEDSTPTTYNVTLKRDEIAVTEGRVDTTYEKFGNGIIGVVALHTFYQGDDGVSAVNDVRDAITKLNKEGNLRGLVIDMRDNTGGFLLQAVKVAGLFISSGVVVVSKYFNGEEHLFRDVDGKAAYEGPLVILTSKETASAAEIVAQALQDYGVALIVGDERTFGKGTIQSQTVTENGGSPFFKVTVGKYYTVSGKTPQLQGVKADIVVPGKFANDEIGEEYLEHPLPPDTIKPEYDDDLSDVESMMRSWYLRFYAPSLQHKVTFWRRMIPALQKNSNYRIGNNKNYQKFLKKAEIEADQEAEAEENGSQPAKKSSYGQGDLQLSEAINIVKDMIILQSTMRNEEGKQALQKHAEAVGK